MLAERTKLMTVEAIGRNTDLIVPAAVIVVMVVMLVPLPTLLLDLLISLNITLSILILLVSMYILNPVDFSIFPSLLLLMTLFRLSLNIASTRLILLHGSDGTSAAGRVIQSFGQFVVGGNYVIGVVVFVVLIAIQYIVINHGAVRISEVAARFTLDAMPGKQMSIDADLSAGLIDEKEARQRRDKVAREAEFYGSMDGAIRFTQRDALASVVIILINIIGGFIIGVAQQGLPVVDAFQTYTILTIGDGLVTAIPSLFISVTGGIITTRAASRSDLGAEISKQLLFSPKPLMIGTAVLAFFGLIPGLPTLPFLSLSLVSGVGAYFARQRSKREELAAQKEELEKIKSAQPPEKIEALLKVNPLALEVGYGLIPLVDPNREANFLDRIKLIRRQLALELGIIVPPIHITDNLKLNFREYAILLKSVEIARGELMMDDYMAINPGTAKQDLDGIATKEPTFGIPAKWIKASEREQAQLLGYTVVDAQTVLATHLVETIKAHAHELVGRQETKTLLDGVSETHPKVVEELVPKLLSVGEVQKVLQSLLSERVSIRDLVTILETLADYSPVTRNVAALAESVRQALSRSICKQYQNEAGELIVFTLSPDIERSISESLVQTEQGTYLALEPNLAKNIIARIKKVTEEIASTSYPIILCSASIRRYLRQLTESFIPSLAILSHNEIPVNTRVVSLGMVGL